MRIGLALIAAAAVAAGAIALARSPGPEDGEAGVTVRRYELRSRFVDKTLPQVAAIPPGGHDGDYWHRHYRDYLRFYARALARC